MDGLCVNEKEKTKSQHFRDEYVDSSSTPEACAYMYPAQCAVETGADPMLACTATNAFLVLHKLLGSISASHISLIDGMSE